MDTKRIHSEVMTQKIKTARGVQMAGMAGFTLLELAIVMVIGGIILSMLASSLVIYMNNAEIKLTRQRMAAVDEAVQDFLNFNGRLPCPASRIAESDTEDYGREVNTVCNDGEMDGTVRAQGLDMRMVRIGAVPVRDLNLPDDYALDAWGSRLTYAVTEILATPNSYERNSGAIYVVDSNDHSVVQPAGSAHYVLNSHGPNRAGAHSASGQGGGIACDNAMLEGENCDEDAHFRRTTLRSTSGGAHHYDDLMIVRAASAYGAAIPAGAVMGFNLAACPSGWVDYADAAGRVVVGAGHYSEQYNEPGRTAWGHTQDYALGEQGGYATWRPTFSELGMGSIPGEGISGGASLMLIGASAPMPIQNMPPYVILRYCQKT